MCIEKKERRSEATSCNEACESESASVADASLGVRVSVLLPWLDEVGIEHDRSRPMAQGSWGCNSGPGGRDLQREGTPDSRLASIEEALHLEDVAPFVVLEERRHAELLAEAAEEGVVGLVALSDALTSRVAIEERKAKSWSATRPIAWSFSVRICGMVRSRKISLPRHRVSDHLRGTS
jgi:hypothetical protein